MIDVLKRLAELDSANPQVEKVAMTNEQSLATVTNIEGEQINECGPMGLGGMESRTPASFSINATAADGAEVSSMLRDIMNLAGVKPAGDALPALDKHSEIELGQPGSLELEPEAPHSAGGDMGDLIGMIDKMNGPGEEGPEEPAGDEGGESPVAKMADEVEAMTAELKDEGVGAGFDSATTTPDEEVEPHKYGNDQVTPKPQGLKQRLGDNPYKPTTESVEQVSLSLLKAYEEFKNGQ